MQPPSPVGFEKSMECSGSSIMTELDSMLDSESQITQFIITPTKTICNVIYPLLIALWPP